MIDVENYIFNAIYDEIAPLCARNSFKSVAEPNPTAFPTVTIWEMKNLTDYNLKSTAEEEDFATLTYEAHIYTTSKGESRKIAGKLDNCLRRLNMTRISGDYSPSTSNTKVQEFVARYRVRVDQSGILYRRS